MGFGVWEPGNPGPQWPKTTLVGSPSVCRLTSAGLGALISGIKGTWSACVCVCTSGGCDATNLTFASRQSANQALA